MGIFLPRLPGCGRPEPTLVPLAGAIAAHAALLAMATLAPPTQELARTIKPMAVRLIEQLPPVSSPQMPPPRLPPPEPHRAPPQPELPAPVPTANAIDTAAADFAVPMPLPAPAPAPVATAAAPAPTPITPARFDADYLHNPQPAYPPASRRLGEQGKVLLRVHVGADGRAGHVEIRHGSGYARLDRAAIDAVALWRFVPARRGSEPIAAWVQVPVTFELES